MVLRESLGAWLSGGAPAGRVWLLQAGPGAGKRETARQLLLAPGIPAFRVELPEDVGAADAERLWGQLAAGGTPFALDIGCPTGGNDGAEAFVVRWLALAGDRVATAVRSARRPAWLTPRMLATGKVTLLSAQDLAFTAQECAVMAGARGLSPEALLPTAGWPLAVATVLRMPGAPGLASLLDQLAVSELWQGLADGEREQALDLWPISGWQPDDVPLGEHDLAALVEHLVRWGAMVLDPDRTASWHPLLRGHLEAEWLRRGTAEERADRQARLADWLVARDPVRAVPVLVGLGRRDEAEAVLLNLVHTVPWTDAQDRIVAEALARFPAKDRHERPVLGMVQGTLWLRRGHHQDALADLEAAGEAFARVGDAGHAFACWARVLAVALQIENLDVGLAAVERADPLEDSVRVDDRVGYAVNRGNLAFLQGREDEAIEHVLRALAFPHLGRPRIALTRAEAALNLALLHHERGSYGQARRTLERLLGDALALELDPSLERRATSHLVLLHLEQGEFTEGVRLLARTQALLLPANGYHQAACLRLEGSACLRLRRLDDAHRVLGRTLDLLHGHGLEAGTESASTLVMLAEVARRRGAVDEAAVLIDRARPLTGGFPRISAILHQHLGMLAWQAGRTADAVAAFTEAAACLEPVVARPQRAWLALALACLENRPELRAPLRREAHRLLMEGPYPFLPLSIREFAPAMLTCLAEEEGSALVSDIGSRFPKAWEAILSEAHPAARVEIRTFGRLVVTVAGKTAAFPRRKARVLLAQLLERPGGMSRDEAADVLFPDLDWDEARHQVDNLTSVLRRALNPGGARDAAPLLLREGGRYRLSREGVWLDLDLFHRARAAGDAAWQAWQQGEAAGHYASALDLAVGPWLAEPDMQEWFEAARTAISGQVMVMRERLAAHALEQGAWEQAREQAEGMLREEPAHEGAHRVLMRLYAALGEASLVQRQFEACAQVLRSELDVSPSAETLALREALRRQDRARA